MFKRGSKKERSGERPLEERERRQSLTESMRVLTASEESVETRIAALDFIVGNFRNRAECIELLKTVAKNPRENIELRGESLAHLLDYGVEWNYAVNALHEVARSFRAEDKAAESFLKNVTYALVSSPARPVFPKSPKHETEALRQTLEQLSDLLQQHKFVNESRLISRRILQKK